MLLGDSVSCMCGGDGVSRTHGWVFIIRPHTGVPEIGRLINAQPCNEYGGVLPVVSCRTIRRLPVAHDHVYKRESLCRMTDFWYSSMRAFGIGSLASRRHRLRLFKPSRPIEYRGSSYEEDS